MAHKMANELFKMKLDDIANEMVKENEVRRQEMIKAVLAAKTLRRANAWLVIPTWILAAATIVLAIGALFD